MKKTIIPFCLALFSIIPVTAQIKKGTVIGGAGVSINASFNSYFHTDVTPIMQRSMQFQLEAGKAVRNNLLLGVRGGVGSTFGNNYDYWNGSLVYAYRPDRFYTGEVFLRKYAPLGKRFMFFAEASLAGLTGTQHKASDNFGDPSFSDLKLKQLSLNGSLGVSYKLSNRVSFDLSFNNLLSTRYSWVKGTSTRISTNEVTPVNDHYFNANPFNGLNRNVSFGIKIRFGRQ